ncbi:MAG: lipoyl protein ligase domain-containing protein [Euzebya sp.]
MADTPPTQWLDLGLERATARELLDRSVQLLDQTGQDGRARLRWYVPTDQAIVLGRGQTDSTAVPGHEQLQRPSGGGVVLMNDDLLSLDIILPSAHPWLADSDLAKVFQPIGQAWASALGDLGVPDVAVHDGPATATRLGPAEQRPLAEVCYASLGRGEVTASGRKLVGLSQRRRRQGALIQCGIMRTWNASVLITALGVDIARAAIEIAAVGLDDVLPGPTSDYSVMRAVRARL